MTTKTEILDILQNYIEVPLGEIATDMPFKTIDDIIAYVENKKSV